MPAVVIKAVGKPAVEASKMVQRFTRRYDAVIARGARVGSCLFVLGSAVKIWRRNIG